MTFSLSNPYLRVLSGAMAAALCFNMAACAGGSPTVPPTPRSIASNVCPESIGPPGGCNGGGSGFTPQTFGLTIGGYASTATTTSPLAVSGTSANLSTGEVYAISGSISPDVSNGVNTIVENDPDISSQPLTLQYIDANYVVPGVNVEPNGGIVTTNATSGTVTESLVDTAGNKWNLTATQDPDGHSVDVSYTGSNGMSGSQVVDGNEVAPTVMAAAQAQSAIIRHATSSTRKTQGAWAVAGSWIVVGGAAIGLVGAGIALVAFVVAAAPIVVGVGLGVAVVGAAVGLAGAVVQAVDTTNDAKKKKT